jgi:CO dehydrogenase maturation factor
MEQGRPFTMADLSNGTSAALGALQDTLDARHRDWSRYTRQATEFHVRNARAWAGAAAGEDLGTQVDPRRLPGTPSLSGVRQAW